MVTRWDQAVLSGPAERDGPARASRFATLPFVWLALAAGLSGGFGLGAVLVLLPPGHSAASARLCCLQWGFGGDTMALAHRRVITASRGTTCGF